MRREKAVLRTRVKALRQQQLSQRGFKLRHVAINRKIMPISDETKANVVRQTAKRVATVECTLGLIAVPKNGRVFLLRAKDVDWIESYDNYVRLHCGQATHIIRATLTGVESRLECAGFLRLNRSGLVNLRAIKELYPLSRGDFRVVLLDGTELMLKKTYRDRLQSRILVGHLGRSASV